MKLTLSIYALPRACFVPAVCGGFHVSVAWEIKEISFESEGVRLIERGTYNRFFLGSRSVGWDIEDLAEHWLNDSPGGYDAEDNNCQRFAGAFVRRNLAYPKGILNLTELYFIF